MSKVIAGFSGMKKAQEEQSSRRLQGDFIQYMRLSDDGDIAKFRIVSSHDPGLTKETGIPSYLISAVFHRHEDFSKNGKRFFTSTICGKEEDDYGNLVGECNLCDIDIPRSLQFMIWVYVYAIYHRKQNNDPENPWEEGKLGAMLVYKEPVEKFMIWQDGYYSSQALEGRIEQYGSLTDRDYMRIRRGARGSQQVRYELERLDPEPIADNIVVQARDLPDLMEVAVGNVRTMGGNADDNSSYAPSQPRENNNVSDRTLLYEEVPMTLPADDDEDMPF